VTLARLKIRLDFDGSSSKLIDRTVVLVMEFSGVLLWRKAKICGSRAASDFSVPPIPSRLRLGAGNLSVTGFAPELM
jgi:hypothetical protein